MDDRAHVSYLLLKFLSVQGRDLVLIEALGIAWWLLDWLFRVTVDGDQLAMLERVVLEHLAAEFKQVVLFALFEELLEQNRQVNFKTFLLQIKQSWNALLVALVSCLQQF